MSSYTSATLPHIDDEDVSKALNALLASNWQKLPEEVKKDVQAVLSKGGPQSELLKDAWRAADAVEKFSDRLEQMRMELDDQSNDGNATKDTFAAALEAVKDRYDRYLGSFGLDENWLRKKVEMELGTPIMQLKQRVSGLGAEWSKISLLSTTGIWGSYIERRYEA